MSEQLEDHVSSKKVQLGCGTLIVIALIVMIFSGGQDAKELRSTVNELNQKIDRLESKVDELSRKVDCQSPATQAAGSEGQK